MEQSQGFLSLLEEFFTGVIVESLTAVIFFDVAFWDDGTKDVLQVPLVVLWLILGAVFFTVRFQFINFRAFRHAIDCVRGRYTRPDERGEISHFQALSAALSATVGLGNIAGVVPEHHVPEQHRIRGLEEQHLKQGLELCEESVGSFRGG